MIINLRKNKAITLIALVITIIVLLILAGVTIASLTGENGLLERASRARNETEKGQIRDEITIAWNSVQIDGKINGYDNEATREALQTELSKTSPATVTLNGTTSLTVKYKGYSTTINLNDGTVTVGNKIVTTTVDYEVGDFVDYTPVPSQSSYTFSNSDSGYSIDKTVYPEGEIDGMYWRVLNINDDGTTDLISSRPTDTDIYFSGAQGYNNGVYLLNEMCEKLYSNNSLSATARSVNIEDIQDHLASRTTYTSYGAGEDWEYGKTRDYTTNKKYPVQWKNDNGATGESLSRNKITGTTTGEESSKLTVTNTYWYAENTTMESAYTKSIYYDLLNNNGTGYFWLASRFVYARDSDYAFFGLRYVDSGEVNGDGVFYSGGSEEYSCFSRVRPIVSLPSNVIHKITAPSGWTNWNEGGDIG